ncbi:YadA-like family protein [Achromobacter aegrifaciens]
MLGVQVLGPFATATGDAAVALGYASSAGMRATAVGMQAVASGMSATALGQWSRATGTGAVAIGGNDTSNTAAAGALASGNNAVAIAGQSRASGGESIAIGVRSSAVNAGDIAVGADSLANGTTSNLASMAIGRGARAVGEDATALGNSSRAEADYGTSVGNFAAATTRNATAVGNSAAASGGAATAIGNFSAASGLNAVAIGGGGMPGTYVGALASGSGAVALGGNQVRGAVAAGQDGIALGGESIVDANAASGIAVGRGARVFDSAAYGVALGDGAAARGQNDIVIGRSAATSAQSAGNNVAMGNGVTTGAAGQNVAIGSGSTSAVASNASGGAVAIGRGQKAAGNGAVALGDPNTANGNGAVAVGENNVAAGDAAGNSAAQGAVAIGSGNQAVGRGSVALGNASWTSAAGSLALGDTARAAALNGVALGSNAVASNAGDVALGAGSSTAAAVGTSQTVINGTTYSFAGTAPSSTVSIGAPNAERTITNVAAGRLSASSTDAINGSQLYATSQAIDQVGDTITNIAGDTSQANTDANGMGIRYVRTNEAGLTKSDASAQGKGSTAVGYNATATAESALALGREAKASHAGSVALGANAVADGATLGTAAYNPGTATIAGITPVGEVSVGSANAERRLTKVAAGATDTDAVNVSQLKSVATSVSDLDAGAVKYDRNPDGTVNYESVTLNPGGAPTTIGNVAAGALSPTSTEAVNGSQLNETNQNVAQIGDTITNIAGDTSQANTDANGMGIRYVRTNEAGLTKSDASAQGQGSTAVGYNATATAESALALGREAKASHAGSVALGANAVADGATLGTAAYNPGTATIAGITPVGEVSVGSANAERRLTKVAAGATDTDAVNVSQLKSVAASVSDLDAGAVKYDRNPDGTVNYESVTLNPGGAPTTIGNVAAGALSPTSTEAVNGSQLNETNQNVAQIGDTITNIAGDTSQANTDANGMGIRYVRTNEAGLTKSDASAQGPGSTAVGYNATATAESALALGREAKASHAGSVALGANAVADGATLGTAAYNPGTATIAGITPVGEVSVGSANAERRLTKVAAGATDTDAVNVSQLKSVAASVSDLDAGAVKYDRNPDGTVNYESVTLNPGGAPTTIGNVASGALSPTSTEAVNGSQLNETNQNVAQIGDTITNIAGDTSQANTDANGMGIRYVRTNEAGLTKRDASAQGQGSTAVGYNATATAESALALGREAKASHAGSVALGANAVADGATLGTAAYNPGTATIAGITPVGEVSVGSANAERRLTKVAAGATDTDAVNVSQLKSVAASVSDLDAGAVKYDRNPDGTVNYESVTLNPGGAPTTIGNVAAGALSPTSTEAVNGSQLNETNQNVAQIGDTITNIAGDTSQANTDANGMGIRYVRTNEAGLTKRDASAQGQGSTAVGYNATATAESALALGRETRANVVGGVALGAGAMSDRALTPSDGSIAVGGGGSLVPFNTTDRTLLGAVSVGSGTSYRQITNVADGTDDHDAVTVRQLTGAMTSLAVTGTRYFHVNSTQEDSLAAGEQSVAIGPNTVVNGEDGIGIGNGAIVEQSGPGGIAIGDGSHAQLADAIALGTKSTAAGEQSVALGAGSRATTVGGVALGTGSVAATQAGVAGYVPATQGAAAVDATRSTLAAVSVGDAATGKFRQITGVGAGTADSDAVNVSQLKSLASNVNDLDAGSVKYDRNPDGTVNYGSVTLNPSGTGGSQLHNVATGTAGTDAVNVDQLNQSIEANKTRYYSVNDNGTRQANAGNDGASGAGAMAAGVGAVASGERALSVGNGNTAIGARSGAIGGGNSVSGGGSYAFGNDNAIASADAFVIGSGVTVGAGLDGAVVLGRGSMAVAASPTPRGTINGVEYVYAGGNPAAGDVVSVGSVNAPRQIQHVAAGRVAADSLDAINGSQLYATNQAIDSLGQVVQNINTGGGIKYFHANGGTAGVLPDSQASGAGSVAVGPSAVAAGSGSIAMGNAAAAGAEGAVAIGAGAQARRQGDVALGDGAIADRGAESYTGKYSNAQNDTAGTVSVGAPGSERTLSNVADGRNATDAVNLRQLDGAVKAANDYTDQRIGDVNQSVVEVGDAVKDLDGRVTQVEGDVTKLKNGADGMFQVSQDAGNVAPRAEGKNSVAGGAGAAASGNNATAVGNGATASGGNSTAMGSGSTASGENATAMGNGSKAEANNSVALGAGSVADRSGAVSVGAAGAERQIINVAPGTAGTDAVNVNQLRDVEGNLSNQIASVKGDLRRQDNRLSAGVASAMAMAALPQAYLPGKSMFSVGGGTWRGESGFAMGLSTVSDNGRWVVKGLASSSSRGDYGGSVGVGYQW